MIDKQWDKTRICVGEATKPSHNNMRLDNMDNYPIHNDIVMKTTVSNRGTEQTRLVLTTWDSNSPQVEVIEVYQSTAKEVQNV
jgi:hypothetical protein